jgi:hypothetical protein
MTQVKVIIVADDSGTITVETHGPIAGKDGLCELLQAALDLARQQQ